MTENAHSLMESLLHSHAGLLPDLAFEVIAADDRYPPNRHMFADPSRPDVRTELIKATWTTRNTKLADVTRLAILPVWSLDKARSILDAKVAEHAKRKDLELVFDPIALSIMTLYTGKDEAALSRMITGTKHDGIITGNVSRHRDPRVLKDGLFTDAAGTRGAWHEKGRSSRTALKLLLSKGNVNIELDAPQFTWNTANRWISLRLPVPESILAGLEGKAVATILEAPWAVGLAITRVDPMEYADCGASCQLHYRSTRSDTAPPPG